MDINEEDIYNIENNENNAINNTIKDKIISFYFLFICLDNDNKNLENSNVVYW